MATVPAGILGRPGRWAGSSDAEPVPVPPEQGLALHEEPSATRAIEQPTEPGEQCPIRRVQGRSGPLATKDGHLVAEHDHLDGQLVAVTSIQLHHRRKLTKARSRNESAMPQCRRPGHLHEITVQDQLPSPPRTLPTLAVSLKRALWVVKPATKLSRG